MRLEQIAVGHERDALAPRAGSCGVKWVLDVVVGAEQAAHGAEQLLAGPSGSVEGRAA